MARTARLFSGLILLGLLVPTGSAQEPTAAQVFDQQIAPLIARRCLDCHHGPAAKRGLDLSSKQGLLKGGKNGPALVPGKPGDSLLWNHVAEGRMPPKKPLPADEKKVLKDWITQGAIWGTDRIDPFRFTSATRAGYDWWALQPVKQPPLPSIQDKTWPHNPIDHFILAGLEAKGLKPTPAAAARTLIRRLTFDLIGLPPTPKEMADFEMRIAELTKQSAIRNPQSAITALPQAAVEELVDRLLASSHYGERWARHWLDVVRFGESHGFEHDELRKNAWPYRDWVIRALNRDMPFPEFARLQIAGDALKPGDPDALAATGFLVAGPYDGVGQVQQSVAMKAVVRQDELEDIVGTVGQTFLGLTVHCARCHDHKFDPIRQTEYYRLTAALAGVRHGERDLTSPSLVKQYEKDAAAQRQQLIELRAQIDAVEKTARAEILAEREKSGNIKELPKPAAAARWDFTKGLKDQLGQLHAQLEGDAKLGPDGLVLSGKTGFAATPALAMNVKARTFAAWVRLDNLQQRGGAAISFQTLDGNVFDAIVFGEREPGHWIAGSDGFQRTQDFHGPLETEAVKNFVHVAMVYDADGTITGYRNGVLYGQPYRSNGPVSFSSGKAQFVFGMRHGPASPQKLLAGTIRQAEFFDRALTTQEMAALAGALDESVTEAEWAKHLDASSMVQRQKVLKAVADLQARSAVPPPALRGYVVAPRPPEPAHLLIRGNPGQKGEVVTPGGVASLAALSAEFGLKADADDASRRTKLADWITDPVNPLFARVIVNRLWHYHFGQGLVETPNDFGFNGGRPSHQELLDWLAAEFWKHGGSLKALHRLIVTSAAYRQGSRFDPVAAKLDVGNRLLWRKNPVRLEAEAVRDAILRVSGRLNVAMSGPGYQDFKLTVRGATHYYTAYDAEDPALERRTVYRTWVRSGRSSFLDTLDCPDPSTVTPKRAVTTTPLQALALLNNPFVLRQADHFAKRLEAASKEVDQQIAFAFQLAYARSPRPEELTAARQVVQRHGLAVLCRAIFNSNEFVYVD